MLKEKLEKNLEDFLQKNNRPHYKDSISYSGLRKMNSSDGFSRMLHIVNFTVSISDQTYDGDALYFATFDEVEHNLVEIVGPQSYEKIS